MPLSVPGLETAKALAFHGAHVVLACRNLQKAEKAVKAILAERKQAQVRRYELVSTALTLVICLFTLYLRTWRVQQCNIMLNMHYHGKNEFTYCFVF